MAFQFKLLAAAGTFDRLHKGHEIFLKKAFELSEKVLIGITSHRLAKKKNHGSLIESFAKRKERLTAFLKKNNFLKRAEIITIDDVYGPTLEKNSPIEAILVTEKTVRGAALINKRRDQLGLSLLKIISIDLVKVGHLPISSTNLRRLSILKKTLILPPTIRPLLQKPQGKLFPGNEQDLTTAVLEVKKYLDQNLPSLVVTVGDVATKSFNQQQLKIDLAIVDFKIKREETIKNLHELGFAKTEPDVIVENKPGTISRELSKAIEQAIQQCNNKSNEPFIIRVLGEEDLAVLPAIIHAPTSTLVFYGQPGDGVVVVEVNKDMKQQAFNLLSKFRS